jgi:predicted MFS family arabinose efflux permease
VSSILGPLAGGLIVEHVAWNWIFWLNLPFGLVSVGLIAAFLHESVEHRRRSIDFAGTALLLVGLSAMMLALTQAEDWGLRPAALLAGVALVTLVLFLRQQKAAPDPVMHFELWSNPIIRRGNLAILCAGIAMIGLITFLPTFVQGVLGGSALAAGFTLSGMSIWWPIASVVAGRSFLRVGVRSLVRAGGLFVVAGSLVIGLFAVRGAVWAGLGAFLMGMGFGLLNTTYIVAIQTSVPWAQRGVATATNMLMRNLGNAIGAAMLGGLLNLRLAQYIERRGLGSTISLDSVRGLIQDGGGVPAGEGAAMAVLQAGLSSSLVLVFWTVAAFSVAILAISWAVPDLAEERIQESEVRSRTA